MVLCELQLWHRLEDFFHVGLHEFHHDEDVVEVVQALWRDDVVDFGGEAVVLHLSELAKNLDLAHDFLGVVLVLEDVVDQFDSNLLTGLSVLGLYNFAVATDSDELDELVLLEGVPPDGGEGHHVAGLLGQRAATGSGLIAGALVTYLLII